jgi:hypothetical protein
LLRFTDPSLKQKSSRLSTSLLCTAPNRASRTSQS